MTSLSNRKHLPIILLMSFAALIGALTVRDYGVSWDEADIYRYSDYALHAYSFFFHPQDLRPFETNLNLYGPGYYMASDLAAAFLTHLVPSWTATTAWHFAYFLTFLGSGLALYTLSKRWVSEYSALGVTLLFLSQPLLWGHAFINPKDIPFLAFFAAAVSSGLSAVDAHRDSSRLHPSLILAAVLLGLTAAFRVLGPLAGIIVLGYAVRVLGRRCAVPGAIYIGVAAATAYLTWPYLWGAVISHYIQSIQTMAQFPFSSNILFGGQLYKATELPWTYFPTFLAIQMTEPTLLLIGLGLAFSVYAFFKRGAAGPLPLFLAWFLIPAAAIVASRSPLYDNARQLLFLLPPLFILAGIALDRILAYLSHPALKAGLLFLMALPGLLLGVRLHPYEYVYYNALVGGTGGAYRQYEMDYWGISFKEITDYLNRTAAPGANVLVFGPEQIVAQYARPDLHVFIPADQPKAVYDYVAFLTRANLDERRCKGAELVQTVERRGAVLSMLKTVPAGADCR
jgi:hypothetical protein